MRIATRVSSMGGRSATFHCISLAANHAMSASENTAISSSPIVLTVRPLKFCVICLSAAMHSLTAACPRSLPNLSKRCVLPTMSANNIASLFESVSAMAHLQHLEQYHRHVVPAAARIGELDRPLRGLLETVRPAVEHRGDVRVRSHSRQPIAAKHVQVTGLEIVMRDIYHDVGI